MCITHLTPSCPNNASVYCADTNIVTPKNPIIGKFVCKFCGFQSEEH